MIVKLSTIPGNLIQSVRIAQAIMEAGVTVSIPPHQKKVFDYLSRFFKVDYTLKDGVPIDVDMSHPKPFVRLGSETRDLLYPASIPNKSLAFWSDRRRGVSFSGFMPDFRKEALQQWEGRARIEETSRGRNTVRRYWDEDYLYRLGESDFVLCPDGGYPWSYRFFEAVFCGATPIVQTESPIYKGFYYLTWDSTRLERMNVDENFRLAKERLTMAPELIRKNIR